MNNQTQATWDGRGKLALAPPCPTLLPQSPQQAFLSSRGSSHLQSARGEPKPSPGRRTRRRWTGSGVVEVGSTVPLYRRPWPPSWRGLGQKAIRVFSPSAGTHSPQWARADGFLTCCEGCGAQDKGAGAPGRQRGDAGQDQETHRYQATQGSQNVEDLRHADIACSQRTLRTCSLRLSSPIPQTRETTARYLLLSAHPPLARGLNEMKTWVQWPRTRNPCSEPPGQMSGPGSQPAGPGNERAPWG